MGDLIEHLDGRRSQVSTVRAPVRTASAGTPEK